VPALAGRRRRTSGEDALAFIGGLLLGGIVAAVVAIFVAPTDGQTLRARLVARFNSLFGFEAPPEFGQEPGEEAPPATPAPEAAAAAVPAAVPAPASYAAAEGDGA
jgi:hypothetical protein